MPCSEKELLLYREANAKEAWRSMINSQNPDPVTIEQLREIAERRSYDVKIHLTSCRECIEER